MLSCLLTLIELCWSCSPCCCTQPSSFSLVLKYHRLLRAEMSLCPQPGREGRKEGRKEGLPYFSTCMRDKGLALTTEFMWFGALIGARMVSHFVHLQNCWEFCSIVMNRKTPILEGQSIVFPPCPLGRYLLVSIIKDELPIKMAFLGSAGRRQSSPVFTRGHQSEVAKAKAT